ncbi:MAG: transglutaminase domain-containing protein [Solirubrobacterales bacterium]|nr:transglutaminase domain-containing protein [Solirubrobacterales bacterium]
MSAVAEVSVLDGAGRARHHRRRTAAAGDRPRLRLITFAALALYGLLRWATLLTPAPGWRLFGCWLLALALAAAGPWLRERHLAAALLSGSVAAIATLALAGIPLAWIVHLRIALIASAIEEGLSGLPGVFLPYGGINEAVRIVIVLGAGVLLLDAGLVLAFAPRSLGDLRRAVAALPLLALAVVPSTLVRPSAPYLQGVVLFALLAAFMWSERIARHAAAGAAAVIALAGALGALLAPALDQHHPWVDYQALAGTLNPVNVETFDWTQRYGPLNWPRTGHEVLDVRATRPDYWKAENLDLFDGVGWSEGATELGAPLPAPAPAAVARWTQTLKVTIRAMKTTDLITAGFSSEPADVAQGVLHGVSPGTWSAGAALGPGDSYLVSSYSPQPTPAQLAAAGSGYPAPGVDPELSIVLPLDGLPDQAVLFAPFGSHGQPQSTNPTTGVSATQLLRASPYAEAYALAQRLARHAGTPYAYVAGVQRYLGHGFSYDENPSTSRYPLATFLFTDKRGYCQQFAGAMALLLRMGGIPARVATGFATGTYDRSSGQWVVSDLDAHAWVEAWFPRYGWVRFDPTPVAAPARGGLAPEPILRASGSLAGKLPRAPKRELGAGSLRGASAPRSGGGAGALLWIALVVLAALAALALRFARTARRPTAERLVGELERALARCGRPPAPDVTLAALERRFRSSPAAASYIRALRLNRFGDGGETPSPAARRALRIQLGAGLGAVGRLRALWALPPRPPGRGRRA